jgi:prepilin-type N-terminal cleavage/methylation domain-containing protein
LPAIRPAARLPGGFSFGTAAALVLPQGDSAMKTSAGFTLIEILVVIAIIATLAGMTVILVGPTHGAGHRIECTNNLRNLAGLIENVSPSGIPNHSGARLVLYLVQRGELQGKDALEQLFCPGDLEESLEQLGGVDAYKNLDLAGSDDYDAFTSYAGPDQTRPQYRLSSAGKMQAMLVDDSEDHHNGKGFLIAFTGGAVKWRDKVDDYGLSFDEAVTIGEGSVVEELRCFKRE